MNKKAIQRIIELSSIPPSMGITRDNESQFEAQANGNAVGDLWHLMSKTDQSYVTKAILRAQRKVLADKLKEVKAKDAE